MISNMGKIDIFKFQNSQNYEQNIERKYRFFLNHEELFSVFKFLSIEDIGHASFIYGYGKQPNSLYRSLEVKSNEDYKVIWYGIPRFRITNFKMLLSKILSSLAASTFGLIEVKNHDKVDFLMNELSMLAMVGFFSTPKSSKNIFQETVIKHVQQFDFFPENYITKDPGFFYFIVDGDTQNDKGEYFCETAFGKNCPERLMRIIDFTEKRW